MAVRKGGSAIRRKASTGGSTLVGEKSDAPDEPEADGKSADDRPRGPAPRSLGLFVVPGSNPPSPGASTIIETRPRPRCGNAIITIASSKTDASGEMHKHASNVPWMQARSQRRVAQWWPLRTETRAEVETHIVRTARKRASLLIMRS